MTLQDLYDKTNFLDICDEHIMLDDVGMVKLTTYTRYNNTLLGNRTVTCLYHNFNVINDNYLIDYTTLSQKDISNLICAKIELDLSEKDILTYKSKHGKVENIFDVLFRGTNKENKLLKYHNLNDLTPRRAQNIINKNLIFINNINSLYASNKILAELNAL